MDGHDAMDGDTAPPASHGTEGSPNPSSPTAGTLLGAPSGVRAQWVGQVGKPHFRGIRLNVGIRFLPGKQEGIDYQIRGVVDVPRPPYGKDERTYLAKVLAASADLPPPGYE